MQNGEWNSTLMVTWLSFSLHEHFELQYDDFGEKNQMYEFTKVDW